MSKLVLTLLCVYVHYNALGRYIKLFALYKNILFMKVIQTENRFSKKSGFNIPNFYAYLINDVCCFDGALVFRNLRPSTVHLYFRLCDRRRCCSHFVLKTAQSAEHYTDML